MNKLLIPLIALILLLAGGSYYYFVQTPKNVQQRQAAMAESAASPTPSTQPEASGSTLMSLKELMAGGSQTCTYTSVIADVGTTTGTVYVNGGKMRSDFTISGDDKATIDGSVISDGAYLYTWNSMVSQGMKIAITDQMKASATSSAAAGKPTGVDLDQKIDYQCQPWIADSGKFVPPATITFSEFKLPATGSATQSKSSLCSTCANLEGEQKTACLTALKCE